MKIIKNLLEAEKIINACKLKDNPESCKRKLLSLVQKDDAANSLNFGGSYAILLPKTDYAFIDGESFKTHFMDLIYCKLCSDGKSVYVKKANGSIQAFPLEDDTILVTL